MSSPKKIREDLEEIKSELGNMGEKLKTLANEGNMHMDSISILVFQAMKILSESASLTDEFEESNGLCDLLGKSP